MLDGLNSVIGIPLIPFTGGQIDYAGHAKNIDYLMNNNSLSESRPRVISIAGTSLVHHVASDDQVKVLDIAGQRMNGEGILMAAVVPNPLPAAADLIARLAALQRPPGCLPDHAAQRHLWSGRLVRNFDELRRSAVGKTGRALPSIITGGRATAT